MQGILHSHISGYPIHNEPDLRSELGLANYWEGLDSS